MGYIGVIGNSILLNVFVQAKNPGVSFGWTLEDSSSTLKIQIVKHTKTPKKLPLS